MKQRYYFLFGLLVLLLIGAKEFSDNLLILGDGESEDITVEANIGDGDDNPKLKFNATDGQWQYANDGQSFLSIGSGGGGGGINVLQNENYDLELGDQKWTASGSSTFSIIETGHFLGKKSGSWDASASGEYLTSTSVALPGALTSGGVMCLAEFYYKGGDSDIGFEVYDGSSVVENSDKTLTASSVWRRDYTVFKCPSSGNVAFRFASTADAAAIDFDMVKIGTNDIISIPDPRWPSYDESYYSITLYDNAGALSSDTGTLTPKQDADGNWVLDVDMELVLGSSDASFEIAISGIDVSTSQGEYVLTNIGAGADYCNNYVSSSDDKIYIRNGTASLEHKIQGRIPLASKPTFATKTAPDVYLGGSVNVDSVAAIYTTDTAGSYATTDTIVFEDLVSDTHSAYNTSTGVYTVPESGYYTINASVKTNNSASAAWANLSLDIDGTPTLWGQRMWNNSGGVQDMGLNMPASVYLTKDQTLEVSFVGNATTALNTNDTYNYLSIVKSPSPQEVANAALTFSTATADRPGLTYAIPVGTILPFAGTSLPNSYLSCDGSAISRTTYAALFAAIGTTWGVGDGSTTFNVPDFETDNRFLRSDGGSLSVGDTQTDELASHTHTYGNSGDRVTGTGSGGLYDAQNAGSYSTGSTGGTETRPNAAVVKYMIKYR